MGFSGVMKKDEPFQGMGTTALIPCFDVVTCGHVAAASQFGGRPVVVMVWVS